MSSLKVLLYAIVASLTIGCASPTGAETLRPRDIRVESTRTHKCQTRGDAKRVDVSRVRIREDGHYRSGTVRVFRDKRGRTTRVEVR